MTSPFGPNYFDLSSEGTLGSQASSNCSLSQNTFELPDYASQPEYSQDSLDGYYADESQQSVNQSFGTCNSTTPLGEINPNWATGYQGNTNMMDYTQSQNNYSYDAYGSYGYNPAFTNSIPSSSYPGSAFSNTSATSHAVSHSERNYLYSQESNYCLNNSQQSVMAHESSFASLSNHSSDQPNSEEKWQNTIAIAAPNSTSTNTLSVSSTQRKIKIEHANENKENKGANSSTEIKLKEKRARNRLAARKCRNKKLNKIKMYEQQISNLLNEIQAREQENARLDERRRKVRRDLYLLLDTRVKRGSNELANK